MKTAVYFMVLIIWKSVVDFDRRSAFVFGYRSNESSGADDRSVADELARRVRVLCWVMTWPNNHRTKAKHVKETWGKRCNKLLFMSTSFDPTLPTIKLNVTEGRNFLWDKTKAAFRYVYEHHRNEADWFLKTDDDTYVVVENLRYLLSGYDSRDMTFLGSLQKGFSPQGFMNGGAGYVLSRAALDRMVTKGLPSRRLCENRKRPNTVTCPNLYNGEDVQISICLARVGVKPSHTLDPSGQARFLQHALRDHLVATSDRATVGRGKDPRLDYNILMRTYLDIDDTCCSHYAVTFHKLVPKEFYLFEYLIYHLRPYGIKLAATELPMAMRSFNKNNPASNRKELTHNATADDRTVADELARHVRVLCWVMTSRADHMDKAKRIKATWGKRCNKLLFVSTFEDTSLPMIKLPVKEGYTQKDLWEKTKAAFRYVYDHHRADADWFLNADDNTYIVVENLRYVLAQYRSQDWLYLGHQLNLYSKQGYLREGEGYVFSYGSLDTLVHEGFGRQREEIELAVCLEGLGLKAIDTQDSFKRGLFFPFTLENTLWQWSRFYRGGEALINCCSEHAVSFRQGQTTDLLLFEYLIYNLRPYGVKFAALEVYRKLQSNEDLWY